MNWRRRDFLKVLGATALAGCALNEAASAGRRAPPAAPPRRILILGGTGFVGPAIVSAARARGHVITLFNRGKTNPLLFPGVETILGDRRTDIGRLKGREWDAVIDTWVRLPRTVREAAELLRDHVGHYLFISTISVYKLGPDPIDEGSPVLTTEDPTVESADLKYYGPLKALAEQEAERAMPGRATSIRAGVIVGPGDPTDRFTYWPVRLSRGGEVLVPGGAGDRMQFIDVRDLGEWIITAIEARHVGTYNAVGPADPSLRAVLAGCQEGVPGDARLTFADDKWLEKNEAGGWGDFPLVVPGDADDRGFALVSAARAIGKGLRFRPIAQTARDTLAWWNAQPEERRARKRPGLAPEREAELLRRWHEQAR